MVQKPTNRPSFFKIICTDDFTRLMRMPPIIGKKYGEILPEKAELRTSSGKTWNVKLERTGDEEREYSFTEGWSEFAEDAELKFGEFLMFCFDGKSIFHVSVFGNNECERQISCQNRLVEDSDMDDGDRDCVPSRKRKPRGLIQNRRSKCSKRVEESKATNSMEEENPLYFELLLTAYNRYRVCLRKKFHVAAGLEQRESVKLEYVPNGSIGNVVLDQRSSSRIDFATGWKEFLRANLHIGKLYSFEFKPNINVIQVNPLHQETNK